ncbi:MAG: hypothetical protein ACE5J7_04625 [Candidatus Aenigmatarchaeota archaeon]
MGSRTRLLLSFDKVERRQVYEACRELGDSFRPYFISDDLYAFAERTRKSLAVSLMRCLPNTYLKDNEKGVPDSFLDICYFPPNFRILLEIDEGNEKDLDMIYTLRFKKILEKTFGKEPKRVDFDRTPKKYSSHHTMPAKAP